MAAEIAAAAALGALVGSFLWPARRPALQLLTAVSFAATVAVRGVHDALLLQLPLVAALIALGAIDLERRVLPNRIVYPLAAWGAIATALVDRDDLLEHLAAGAGAFTVLLVLVLVHPPGMGMGDVKLAGAMGLCLGAAVVPALVVAFLGGSLAGLWIVLREGVVARKRTLPFGVFLAVGGITAVMAGPELTDLYGEAFLS